MTAGQGEILASDSYRAFAAPCVLFIPAGEVHGFRFADGTDGLVMTALADRIEALKAADRRIAIFATNIRVVDLARSDREATAALDSLAHIHAELGGQATGRTMLLEALTTQAIVHLVRVAETIAPGDPASHDRNRRRVDELQTLIGAHFREHRPVSFYARTLGLSPAHLNRLARGETGLSVQALVSRRVLEAARRDLVFTPSSVQAIAFSLGFSDPAYFNRFFRKLAGLTPGEYRRSERQKLVG